ncbi:MAG: response regulator transcription factor [Desulfobacteraceae bacterium]|nr:response regulator transcription factor [Desulfobacteraceae bacterium]
MKSPRAVIADDEKNLLKSLKKALNKLWPELLISGEACNGKQAVDLIEKIRPDVAFLDIKMPGLTGIEVAKEIDGICKVVFVTAYDSYAVEAFENEALDYILKPFEEKRLLKTINRLKEKFLSDDDPPHAGEKIVRIINKLKKDEKSSFLQLIKVKTGTEIRFIPVSEVLFFMAEDKYTTVKTEEKEFLIKKTIKELETELDPEQFWRVHRSSIINIDKIKKVTRSFSNQLVVMFNNTDRSVIVSRAYSHLFKQM